MQDEISPVNICAGTTSRLPAVCRLRRSEIPNFTQALRKFGGEFVFVSV
jgi:hypothetical protein